MSAGRKNSMVGYAKVDTEKLNGWIQEQTEQINTKAQDNYLKAAGFTEDEIAYFRGKQEGKV